QPALRRLCFVLIGVATPNELIRDPRRTPFNIGTGIELSDFTPAGARPLADGFGLPPDAAEQLLQWVLAWTGGHPYLTQRLCRAVAEAERKQWTAGAVDAVVAHTFFGETSEKDHYGSVRRVLIERSGDAAAILTLYREIHRGRRVPDKEGSLLH